MRHKFVTPAALRAAVIVGVLLPALSARAATPTDMTVKTTGASFKVGREGSYTVTVANRGKQPTDAEVHVRVTLPAGLSFASHTGFAWTCSVEGQSVDCVTHDSFRVGRTQTLRLKVGVCDAAFPSVVTSFEVAYVADTNTSNNVATRFTTVRPGQCASATATPSATSGSATVTSAPSGTVTPTRTVTNTQAATATRTSTVTPGGPTATPTPTPFGQYQLSLSGAPRNLMIGGVTTVTYRIDVQNVRPISMTNVTITNTLPAGLEFVESVPPPDTQAGNKLTYIVPSMASLSTTSIMIQAELLPTTLAGTLLTDTVQLTDDLANFAQASFTGSVRAGPGATSGSATATSAPSGTITPTRTVTKTQAATATRTNTVTPGGPTATPTPTPFGQYQLSLSGAPRNLTIGAVTTATYHITVQNVRPISMTNVTITNTLPAGLEFVESVPPPDTQEGNKLTYVFPSMASLSTTSIMIQAELLPTTLAGTLLTDTVQLTDDLANFAQASFTGSVRAGPR